MDAGFRAARAHGQHPCGRRSVGRLGISVGRHLRSRTGPGVLQRNHATSLVEVAACGDRLALEKAGSHLSATQLCMSRKRCATLMKKYANGCPKVIVRTTASIEWIAAGIDTSVLEGISSHNTLLVEGLQHCRGACLV